MANDAQKKIVEQNDKIMKRLRKAVMILAAFHLVMQVIRIRSLHFSRIVVSGLSLAVIGYCTKFLTRAAQPSVNKDSELRGNRLITDGVLYNTFFDVIYLFSFCLFLYSFADVLAWAYLSIPVFAVVVLWIKIIKPWLFKSRFTDEAQTQKDAEMMKLYQKYQEREERGRRKYKY